MNLNAIVNDPAQQSWRSFTLDEANRALVLVKRIASDLVEAHGRMLDLHESAEAAAEAGAGQVDGMYRELRCVVDKLHGYLNWDFLDSFSPTTTVGVCRDSTDELGSGKHCS